MMPCPEPTHEPPAPVTGGMRWRTRDHDYDATLRRNRGLPRRRPGDAVSGGTPNAPAPDPGTSQGPVISSFPPDEARAGEVYGYHPRAYDGICDGFTWYFAECPPGMAVDRHTGVVSWTPADGGRFRVTLCARSLYGTVSKQTWELCVRKAAAVRKNTPNPRFRGALRRKTSGGARPSRCGAYVPWREGRRRPVPPPRAAAPPGDRPCAAMPLRL